MFIGQHSCQIKDSQRFQLPSVFLKELGGEVVITQGFDRNLLALPVETFKSLSKIVSSLNIADPLARGLQRMLLGSAVYIQLGQDGTVNLPSTLSEFAKLASEAVVVGQGNFFEVWSTTLWEQQELNLQDAEANAHRFSSVDLSGF